MRTADLLYSQGTQVSGCHSRLARSLVQESRGMKAMLSFWCMSVPTPSSAPHPLVRHFCSAVTKAAGWLSTGCLQSPSPQLHPAPLAFCPGALGAAAGSLSAIPSVQTWGEGILRVWDSGDELAPHNLRPTRSCPVPASTVTTSTVTTGPAVPPSLWAPVLQQTALHRPLSQALPPGTRSKVTGACELG